jgi:hypothetical protein
VSEKNAETGAMMDYSVTVEDYRDFLFIPFDLWYNHGQPVASIRLFYTEQRFRALKESYSKCCFM